jgi:hypothetical protein
MTPWRHTLKKKKSKEGIPITSVGSTPTEITQTPGNTVTHEERGKEYSSAIGENDEKKQKGKRKKKDRRVCVCVCTVDKKQAKDSADKGKRQRVHGERRREKKKKKRNTEEENTEVLLMIIIDA